jgi:uroporphyrinogen decarboxylase
VSSFLNALDGVNFGAPPVWFMRQAGRYLPSYQKMRREHSLLNMFKTPALAHRVTLLPFQDLDLDAAIIFSDILVIFEALGFQVEYPLEGGPKILAPSEIGDVLSSIKMNPVQDSLKYVFESIQKVKPDLSVPLLGFSGSPFTLLAYLLEKPMKDDIKKVKQVLYQKPQEAHLLLDILTHVLIEFIDLQIDAGIDAFQLFDTASTWLSDASYQQFSLPYSEIILKHLATKKIPSILFSKSSSSRMHHHALSSAKAISCDWTSSVLELNKFLAPQQALQGNLDPYLTTLSFESIEQELESLLEATKDMPNFIFNLGHGVLPETKLDTLQSIINKIKSYHDAKGGIEQSIASGFPPDKKPNFVPLS